MAVVPLLGGAATPAWLMRPAPVAQQVRPSADGGGSGSEVSSIGIGVQNNSRKYATEAPYRPEQIALLRAAFDQGVSFFDTAEAYSPHECKRMALK
ncbi:aldo/keto reductase [Sphingobium indicum]|uniref:aldo/keto reductase n=1 Tax=Sphingobium indicum TaxID=332055 RepID=UPI0005688915|nr:aldo/keto reductase [Sphingobium indicum]